MKRWIVGLVVALAMGFVNESHSAVINADDHPLLTGTPHTNAILDTATNRLWLDVNETFGLSLNQVASRLGSGGEYEGWQLPGLWDMEELLVNANIPYPTAPPGYDLAYVPGFNQPISDLVDIYGIANGTSLGDQLEIGISAGLVGRIVLSDGEYGSLGGHRARLMTTIYYDGNTAYNTVGIALFRSVPEPPAVPEPATLIIWSVLGALCMAVVWYRRRKLA